MELLYISPELSVRGFKQSCISNAMDGTDDDMLWNGSERECEKGEGTDCEDRGSVIDW